MGTQILVPMDGSELAATALEYALETFPDAELTVLHVVGVPSLFMGDATSLALETDLEAAGEERAGEVFDRAREVAEDYDADLQTQVALGRPAKAIVEVAASFDTVVLGSHGSDTIERILLGNVAETVVRRSPVLVVVVR